jgi:hypothetical protein
MTSSSRSSRACRTCLSAGPPASPGGGAPSSPSPTLNNSRKLPQILAGFFYNTSTCFFTNTSGTSPPSVDPSFTFLLDREREGLALLDGCNGLLVCRCFRFADQRQFDYLVINLATEKWVAVSITWRWSNKVQTTRLGFDQVVSSHFHVFEFQLRRCSVNPIPSGLKWIEINFDLYRIYSSSFQERFGIIKHALTWDGDSDSEVDDCNGDGRVLGVKIYSSETGLWSYKESSWPVDAGLDPDLTSVFLNGMLYVITTCFLGSHFQIAAVDVEGKTLRIIDFPISEDSPFYKTDDVGFIDLSQGKLHLANTYDMTEDKLTIWVLEDLNSEDQTLKHTVSFSHLVREEHVQLPFYGFIIVAIHPDCNMVFFINCDIRLMSDDMDSGEVHMISNLGQNGYDTSYIPYVPLFSESLGSGQQ